MNDNQNDVAKCFCFNVCNIVTPDLRTPYNAYLIAISDWNAGNIFPDDWKIFCLFLLFVYLSCHLPYFMC